MKTKCCILECDKREPIDGGHDGVAVWIYVVAALSAVLMLVLVIVAAVYCTK